MEERIPSGEATGGSPAAAGSVDSLFAERLAAAQTPEEHGDPLSKSDHVQLFVAGVAVPVIILVLGWIIHG